MKTVRKTLAALLASAIAGCSGYGSNYPATPAPPSNVQQATIGAQGGVITGTAGTALAGVKIVIPAGALASDTVIQIKPADVEAQLPATVLRIGPQIDIGPAGTQLAVPAQVTLPFDANALAANDRFEDEVGAQAVAGGAKKQVDSGTGSVTISLSTLDQVAASVNVPGPQDRIQFDLHANPKNLTCVAQFPGDAQNAPQVTATVVRGELNDSLSLRGKNLKPGLRFALFSTEHSALKADGSADTNNVGLSWYQSDLEVNEAGRVRVDLRTVLLDQSFGVDGAILPATNAFHLGFWFDNPADAVACGFSPNGGTPFNGEHKAGPLAMITVPDATTALGPLCSRADTSTTPAHCKL